MAESIAELKKLTDEEIIRKHDEIARHTAVGTSHYLQELRDRENSKLAGSVERLTHKIFLLTVLMAVATFVQLIIALKLF
jgi:hypothetical protein